MAKKKAKKVAAASKKRHRRSDQELISDLKQRISDLKQRQEARHLKQSPAVRAALSAVRQIDKGLDLAADEGNGKLRHALADSRKPIEAYLKSEGMKLPKARMPRGRRPKPD